MSAIDKVISEYREKTWKVYFRDIHEELPIEKNSPPVYIAESQFSANLAEQNKLPEEFIFLDLEILAAELQNPKLVPFSHCQGQGPTGRLSQEWNGHPKGKMAIATYAPDEVSQLKTPFKVCHLWLIEA